MTEAERAALRAQPHYDPIFVLDSYWFYGYDTAWQDPPSGWTYAEWIEAFFREARFACVIPALRFKGLAMLRGYGRGVRYRRAGGTKYDDLKKVAS